MRKLKSTIPDWMQKDLKEIDEQYPELKEKIKISRADADELIEALKSVELWVESLWDFINTRDRYTEAIPLLIQYLPKLKDNNNIEAVIRALTIKEAKGIACQAVITAYHSGDKTNEHHHSITIIHRSPQRKVFYVMSIIFCGT